MNRLSLEQRLSFLYRYYPQWRTKDTSTHDQGKWQIAGMSREEVCEILDVDLNASEDQITTVLQRLVLNPHTDRGDLDYLTMKINQARDILLKSKIKVRNKKGLHLQTFFYWFALVD